MKKIALVFPGYGSQFVGMGKELYDESRIIQEYFEEAANCSNINFVKLCFASSDVELGRAEHAYQALFLLGSAIAALLKHEGIEPAVVVGYDTGYLAALHSVNGLNFPDGLYLLAKYASLYQELLTSITVRCLQVRTDSHRLKALCQRIAREMHTAIDIGIVDTYAGHKVTGLMEAVDMVGKLLRDQGIESSDADNEIGLHNPLMEGVAASLEVYSTKVDFKTVTTPVLSMLNGHLLRDGLQLKETMLRIITHPLNWDTVLERLADYDIIVHCGPESSALQSIAKYYPEKQCLAINKLQDIDKLKHSIQVPPI